MNRRDFLQLVSAIVAGAAMPRALFAIEAKGTGLKEVTQEYFLKILEGFIRNAQATSPTFAVADFPDGTMLSSCCNPRQQTYVSTARMLPAIAASIIGKDEKASVAGESIDLVKLMASAYSAAFNPAAPEYWGKSRGDKPDQKQVEASLVAYSLWLVGEPLLTALTSEDRTNINNWLASCTVVPERKHNHAWFSAINQAVRLELSAKYPEFQGDEQWMLNDVKALDGMAIARGWYNDWPEAEVYDYYNFWTYASHFLYWNQICGKKYPELQKRYLERLAQFLETAPYFFSGEGGHVLFGRSLIYRWAVLTSLVLAYQQGLWPHSAGLLKRIIRMNFEWHWKLDPYDAELGKLRETYSPGGNHEVTERYIDNGHPYWCMQAFSMLALPDNDPLWTADEEPLPIEKADFDIAWEELGMRLHGTKRTGHVQWLQSRNIHKETYRDKYIKFAYSSHFPFNVLAMKERIPWDMTLVFRDVKTGKVYGRTAVESGEVIENGLQSDWSVKIDGEIIRIRSAITYNADFLYAGHEIHVPEGLHSTELEVIEGSYPLGLAYDEEVTSESIDLGRHFHLNIASDRSGFYIACTTGDRESRLSVVETFEEMGRRDTNVIYPRNAVITKIAPLRKPRHVTMTQFYISPKPEEVWRRLLKKPDFIGTPIIID